MLEVGKKNHKAINFYKKCGFRYISKNNSTGFITMEKDIDE